MLDFKTFCYLQNQKTGCTFVLFFLREFANEPHVNHGKHATAKEREPAKFYFINIREPLTLYRSLYAYGLDGKGTLFMRFKQLGLEQMYAKGIDGFSDWLRYVLDSRNAGTLNNNYKPNVSELIGLASWRFMRLAVLDFERAALRFGDRKELMQYVKDNYFMNSVLKQETLRADLSRLIQGQMKSRITDVEKGLAWIEASPNANQSFSFTDKDEIRVDEDVMAQLFNKERYVYRSFYPEAAGYAQWRANKEK